MVVLAGVALMVYFRPAMGVESDQRLRTRNRILAVVAVAGLGVLLSLLFLARVGVQAFRHEVGSFGALAAEATTAREPRHGALPSGALALALVLAMLLFKPAPMYK